jgi:hypothetical protein
MAADDLLHQIWDDLPPYAECYMEPTFTHHDVEAAAHLVSAAPNRFRGLIALCAYWIGLPNPAYREIVDNVWNHDHRHLIDAATRGGAQVRRMFAVAKFPVPFSEPVTVYRGSDILESRKAVRGLAWTTSHEVACWFAYRYSRERPLVLKATVLPTDVIYWNNELGESEVILRRVPPLMLDDQATRWQEIADNLTKARQAAQTAKLRRRSNHGIG